ncbi:MAG: aminotransferase class I/II-fold pyridoxal phosphate-dependent enzyme [Candidatus Caldarchaeum sp.]
MANDLSALREESRRLAVELVKILAARREVVNKIADLKKASGQPLVVPNVEAEVRKAMLEEAAKHGLSVETINRIATIVFSDAVEQQQAKPKPALTHFDILRRAVELQKNGREVQRLEVGEPDLGAPPEVRNSTANAVLEGYARYIDSRGLAELRAAIVKTVYERYGLEISPENVIVTPGGRFSIYLAAKTLLREGDELLVIDPSWPMYRQVAPFVGARSIHVKTRLEDGWTPSLNEIEKHISPSTKAIILNYPNNPTGKILDRITFNKLVEFATEHGITIISDEVYADYVRNGHVSILDNELGKQHVLIQSFSKSYGMTGYRIGYVIADKNLIAKMASIIGLIITCVPEFIQMGALTALALKDTPKQYAAVMMRRMELAVRELEKIGAEFYRPDGGMYVFPRIGKLGDDAMATAFELLESKGVAVAPGSIFGGYDEFVRISLGASDESIAKGIRLLGEFITEKGSKRG